MTKTPTINEINQAIIQGLFTNDQLDSIATAIKFARNQIAAKNKYSFRLGATVKFTSNRTGQVVVGTVKKINPKFILVTEGLTTWRVPANMLSAA
jgi:hypothetical protein